MKSWRYLLAAWMAVAPAIASAEDVSPTYTVPGQAAKEDAVHGVVILCPSSDGSNTAVACSNNPGSGGGSNSGGGVASSVAVTNLPATQNVAGTVTTNDGGVAVSGATMPSGGYGLTGWLSAIWAKLSGTLSVTVTNQPAPVTSVAVNNLPATQAVSGMVSVSNLPATQQVAGSVSVANLPATQQVAGSVTNNDGGTPIVGISMPPGGVGLTGWLSAIWSKLASTLTVSVANLPATQTVAGAVSVTNLPSTQQVAGTVAVSNLPSTQQVAGTVTTTASGAPVSSTSMPAGGSGELGWLSAIYAQLVSNGVSSGSSGGGSGSPASTVSVSNFPTTQAVSGTVTANDGGAAVTGANMPAGGSGLTGWLSAIWNKLGSISGTVSVSNLPATQQVAGTVSLQGALPAGQNALGSVSVSNFPSSQPVTGAVSVSNFPSSTSVYGTVTANDGGTAISGASMPSGGAGLTGWMSAIWSKLSGTLNVSVGNFPANQTVSGSVSVSNLPATQAVSGSVSVLNLPSTQQVGGSVAVTNLPATQAVSGTVTTNDGGTKTTASAMPAGGAGVIGWLSAIWAELNGTLNVNVGNLPATQTVAGSVSVSNLPATQAVSGSVSVSNLPSTQAVSGTVSTTATGAPITGTSIPAGGTGELGWLSAIYQAIISNAGSGGGTASTVSVSNFPSTQAVSGSVAVSSLPAVSGAVSVTNLPATQAVSGTVTANDGGSKITSATMPAGGTGLMGWLSAIWAELQGTLSVSGSVYVTGALPAGSNSIGSVSVSNFPSTQPVSGSVSVSNFPGSTSVYGSVTSSDSGTAITGATMPSGGQGLTGWLSAIWAKLSGTLSVGGSVSVSNLPATQAVSGTVAVSNLPATQPVSGSVNVGNFPATQPVSGSVGLTGALPAGANAIGSVSVSNLPATQAVSGSVSVSNLPATQAVSGNVGVSGTVTSNDGGAKITAATMPSGGSGLTGWLSGIWQELAGTLNVGGTVAVSNFPSSQAVSGTVAVSNLPSTQAISGSVAVSSLPALPAGSNGIGSVSVSNFPATQPVSGSVNANVSGTVAVSNLPATQAVSGTVTANDGGTAATGSSMPSGGVGLMGWLSGVYTKLAGTLTTTITGALPAGSNNIGAVSVSNFPGTQAVSGSVGVSSLPALPAGSNAIGSVSVSNLPSTQAVSGSVSVSNFPATQPVSGTVAVSSLPSVSVSNFPATQAVSGSVGVSGTVTANDGGAAISGASMPSGGSGMTGWLSAIWSKLSGTLSVGGTVNVGNFPGTQAVSGSVSVSNLPATQAVSGSVAVSSLPALPAGSNGIGSVSVSNFPSTQQVGGTVAVSSLPSVAVNNFPSTQAVSGSVGVSGTVSVGNFPGTQAVSGTVAVSSIPSAPAALGTTNGWTPLLANGLSTSVKVVKSSAGQIGMLQCYNPNSSQVYVQVFNTTSPTLGSTAPLMSLPIAPTATGGYALSNPGINFSSAISIAVTTTATGSTAAATATDCNVAYN